MRRFKLMIGVLVVCQLAVACVNLTPVRRVGDGPVTVAPDPLDNVLLNIEISRERQDWREGEFWIHQVELGRTQDFANWFEPRAHNFPPLWIYAAAHRMNLGGHTLKAAFWYLVARERHIRHLRRCRDDSAKGQLTWVDGAFANLRTDMAQSPELTRYAAKHGFTWLDLNKDTDVGLLESCTWGNWGADRAAQGQLVPVERDGQTIYVLTPPPVTNPANWIIPVDGIHQIHTWSRILMKKEVARILNEPDEVPPTPTMTPLR